MHIPDGYMSPQTSLPLIGAMLPLWSVAVAKIKKVINYKQIPLLSLCAAFSFVIMMLNVPLGASSVHAVGAVFIAILMGPWAACIAVSVALIIQAFVFGDGGMLAIGANCFNMAFAMPFVGYWVYKLIAGDSDIKSKRSLAGVFAGSYVGINVAALLTAIEFGIQPLLFKTAEGAPLYGFYPLSVSVPVMALEHLVFAGPIEGIVTVLAVAYLAKFSPELFNRMGNKNAEPAVGTTFSRYKAFFIGIITLVLISPLGLLATGTAWGEWGTDEIQEQLGYVPKGFEKISTLWSAFMPDYTVPGLGEGFFQTSAGYIASGIVGALLIAMVMLLSSKFIVRKNSEENQSR